MSKRLCILFGTRPEFIKLLPVILKFKELNCSFSLVNTGQHKEVLNELLAFFNIEIDYDLAVMKTCSDLSSLSTVLTSRISPILAEISPDILVVQGDTTSAYIGALCAFYQKVPVAHVEAGLRSGDDYSPFPEEMNRKLISQIAQYHFAPTKRSVDILVAEGISTGVYCVGNTVIDSLFYVSKNYNLTSLLKESNIAIMEGHKKLILMTCHRRENFGDPFKNICNAVIQLLHERDDIHVVFPVHPNPNIKDLAYQELNHPSISLIDSVGYPQLVSLIQKSYLILTDSGGIQEEAPSLGKPVLVIRDTTERVEGIDAGVSKLVGTSSESIVNAVNDLCDNSDSYNKMSKVVNPYGDGRSADKICEILCKL